MEGVLTSHSGQELIILNVIGRTSSLGDSFYIASNWNVTYLLYRIIFDDFLEHCELWWLLKCG